MPSSFRQLGDELAQSCSPPPTTRRGELIKISEADTSPVQVFVLPTSRMEVLLARGSVTDRTCCWHFARCRRRRRRRRANCIPRAGRAGSASSSSGHLLIARFVRRSIARPITSRPRAGAGNRCRLARQSNALSASSPASPRQQGRPHLLLWFGAAGVEP